MILSKIDYPLITYMTRPARPRYHNNDSTGNRQVKAGCLVQYPGGAIAKVSWVRCGYFATEITHHTSGKRCNEVKVVYPEEL